LEGLWEGKRLDGRGWLEERNLEITFGHDWGCCQVTLGRTIVLAQVSAHVTEPRVARPNEGILLVNVELSPIAAPKFEVGRLTDEGVEINRTIERCLKESRCLDLESLCIISEEKVWAVRLDLHILNHCGNMTDACSVAGLAALCHFRRPDVTLKGDVITVHPITERDPVPLAVHHHPVTTTFALFQTSSGESLSVMDPARLEEECMGGRLVVGVNAYREVCTLHLGGQVLVDKKLVLRLTNSAADRAKKIVEKIKSSLSKEEALRQSGAPRGFAAVIKSLSINQNASEKKEFDFSKLGREAKTVIKNTPDISETPCNVTSSESDNITEIVPETMEIEDSDEDETSDIEITAEKSKEEIMKEKITAHIDLDDSEEEETVTLTKV